MPLIMQYFIVFKAFTQFQFILYMPVIMQYFIVLKLLCFKLLSFCIILPIFSCLSKKPNKTQKTNKTPWVGLFLKPFFLTLLKNQLQTESNFSY